ncbi:MAG TPA: adenosylcobinamide-phosphate synthase CbiB, partial [Desulfurivibrionaceae bacterium]|nr:adenosylcobinamide-phosphate synthase CbiB [Desulfurivibrionaceae bacterium]
MRLEYQILVALALDLLLGDPQWLPHPVRGIGWLTARFETISRALLPARAAGIATVLLTIMATGFAAWALLAGANAFHPALGAAVSILLLYTSFAVRDLLRHGQQVAQALAANDLPLARQRVAWLVSRDTGLLDAQGITRATVESLAENLVDGITAPLCFAFLGGPIGVLCYKAASTMDSMFGYKNERYREFGWAAARLDDLLNFVPARLTGLLIPVAAGFTGLDWRSSWRIFRRDRLNHASPNSGHSEAAVAGALGVQLGGPG